jgi:hypothetical protein
MSINKTTTATLAEASAAQVSWAIANYFLYRTDNTMINLLGKSEYGYFVDTPALHSNIGVPCGGPFLSSSGAWQRRYSQGWTVVNPSPTDTVAAQLPPLTWQDLDGNIVSGTVMVPPITGYVLTPVEGSRLSGRGQS